MEKICKNCKYYNCHKLYKRCSDCKLSDYGCDICACVKVNHTAVICKYFTETQPERRKLK